MGLLSAVSGFFGGVSKVIGSLFDLATNKVFKPVMDFVFDGSDGDNLFDNVIDVFTGDEKTGYKGLIPSVVDFFDGGEEEMAQFTAPPNSKGGDGLEPLESLEGKMYAHFNSGGSQNETKGMWDKISGFASSDAGGAILGGALVGVGSYMEKKEVAEIQQKSALDQIDRSGDVRKEINEQEAEIKREEEDRKDEAWNKLTDANKDFSYQAPQGLLARNQQAVAQAEEIKKRYGI